LLRPARPVPRLSCATCETRRCAPSAPQVPASRDNTTQCAPTFAQGRRCRLQCDLVVPLAVLRGSGACEVHSGHRSLRGRHQTSTTRPYFTLPLTPDSRQTSPRHVCDNSSTIPRVQTAAPGAILRQRSIQSTGVSAGECQPRDTRCAEPLVTIKKTCQS
jgi:hypothetical protein